MCQSTISTSTALAISLLMLSACGQTGPLYQPGNEGEASDAGTEREQIEENIGEEKSKTAEPDKLQEQPMPASGTRDP